MIKRVPNKERQLLQAMLALRARRKARAEELPLEIAPVGVPETSPAPEVATRPVEPTKSPAPTRSKLLPKPKPVLMSTARFEAYPGAGDFVRGMVRRGWTPSEAAGAAGNVHVESGFRPDIKSSVPGEQSYGFLQWNKERLEGLKNMALATGRDWMDPETQMDWIHMERTGDSVKYGGGDERSAYKKAFAGGGTPEDIAERFGRHVERPADLSQSVATRRAAALRYILEAM